MATLDLTDSVHLQRMPTSLSSRTQVDRFTARYDYRNMGLAVACTETSPDVWNVSTYPGLPTISDIVWNLADEVYYGGQTYTVDGSLQAALDAAGYDAGEVPV